MRNIAFFQLEDWEKEELIIGDFFAGQDVKVTTSQEVLRPEVIMPQSDFEVISVFVDSAINKDILERLPNIKLIATRSTGYDHIDLEECNKRGIKVANVPSYGSDTVAEYTFALLLALSRKIYDSYNRVRETGSFDLEGLRGFDLSGKKLAVIGVGRIGSNVIKIAKGFDMEVLAYDPHPNPELAQEYGFTYDTLENVLKQADIITIHTPYLPATHHLLNEETLALCKKGAYLINTARGPIVKTEALIRSLAQGHLAGAALDVLEEEGSIKDELALMTGGRTLDKDPDYKTMLANHLLIDMPNVIITPHNAFNTTEALKRITSTTIENIQKYLAGQPINLVN
ncbi:MAG TPA: hydroxyacid dehydrogenase [Candidatus Vogelbacteria bacterium]|nr:hydroxyacid dehydrogenase [Candidatus Vogelbacteria bacterium]